MTVKLFDYKQTANNTETPVPPSSGIKPFSYVKPTETQALALKPVSTYTPPKVDDTSNFSSWYDSFKKSTSSFRTDFSNMITSTIVGTPRNIDIALTKGAQAAENVYANFTADRSKENVSDLYNTGTGQSPNTTKPQAQPIVKSPRDSFYQDIIDDLGKGKLDEKNWDTKIIKYVQDLGDYDQRMAGIDPNNRSFYENVKGGFGSMAGMFVPSSLVGKTAGLLAKTENTAKVYSGVGNTLMTLSEAFQEGDGVFKQVYDETGDVQNAQEKADNTILSNLAILGITNKYSKYFESNAPGFFNLVKGAITSSVSEGTQEGIQQIISNINSGRPIFEGVRDAATIGAIIGAPTHIAGQVLAPKEKKEMEEVKNKIIQDNKNNPVVADYAKNEKIMSETMNYIKETKEIETPEEVVLKLIEAGMDESTATKMMQESVLQEIQQSSQVMDSDALNADIEAFMAGRVEAKPIETIKAEDQVDEETKTRTKEANDKIKELSDELTNTRGENSIMGKSIKEYTENIMGLDTYQILSTLDKAERASKEDLSELLGSESGQSGVARFKNGKKSKLKVSKLWSNASEYAEFLGYDSQAFEKTDEIDFLQGKLESFRQLREEFKNRKSERPIVKEINKHKRTLEVLTGEKQEYISSRYKKDEKVAVKPQKKEFNSKNKHEYAKDTDEYKAQEKGVAKMLEKGKTKEEVAKDIQENLNVSEDYARKLVGLEEKVAEYKPTEEEKAIEDNKNTIKEMSSEPEFQRIESLYDENKLTLKTLEKLKGKETVSKQFISDLTNSGDIKQVERDLIRKILDEESVSDPMTEEARKYKTVEEFIEAQTALFHRTDVLFDTFNTSLDPDEQGTWFAKDKEIVEDSKEEYPILMERFADKSLSLINEKEVSEIEKEDDYLDSDQTQAEYLTDKGYDGIDYGESILLFNPNEDTYTKSELTDIWDRANKGDKVNVPDFIEKAQMELLPLTVKEVWSDFQKYEHISLSNDLRGNVKNYKEKIYESPIKTSAGDVHFKDQDTSNYFGHTRIEDMAGNKIRRVIEVQSDLYQRGRLDEEFEDMSKMQTDPIKLKEIFSFLTDKEIEKMSIDAKNNLAKKEKEKASLSQYNNPTAHFRMVREEVKRAAIDGKKDLLFPTGETAMKIEGLGQITTFRIEKRSLGENAAMRDFEVLSPQNMEVGKEIFDNGRNNWVITDVLGEGKFKAIPKRDMEIKNDFELYTKAKDWGFFNEEDTLDWNKIVLDDPFMSMLNKSNYVEQFDISGKVDTNNPIYKFYDKELRNYLKNRYDAKEITDDKGVTWIEVAIKPEMAESPVEAFQRKDQQKDEMSFEDGKKTLEAYKKRLNLEFNVNFADVIFTGEVFANGEKVRARGVTHNNAITLTNNLTKTTADHELVHLIVDNLANIDAFKDITRENLLKAQNKGREVDYSNRAEVERLNEELAIGFENKLKGDSQSNVPIIIRRFYEKLQVLLSDFLKAFDIKQRNAVADFYRRLLTATGNKNTVTLKSNPAFASMARFNKNGKTGLDFSYRNMKEMDDIRPNTSFERHGTENMEFMREFMPEYYDLVTRNDPKRGIESVFKNALEFLGLEAEEGKGEYDKVTFKDQIAKALTIVRENESLATEIAMGTKKAPEGVNFTAISIAVQSKAMKDKNWKLFKDVAEVRSSKQTEAGQTIVLEKLRNIEMDSFAKIYSDFQELQNNLVKENFYKNWVHAFNKENKESVEKTIKKATQKEVVKLDKKLQIENIISDIDINSILNSLAC